MKSQRTDVYRPSVINPEDFVFVCFDYIGGSDLGAIMMLKAERETFRAHMAHTGGRFASIEHGGSCFVCGAYASYLCTWYNAKTNEYIQTGEDCAQKMDMSYGDSNAFRKAIRSGIEAQAGKKKAQALLAEAGLSEAWTVYTAVYPKHADGCEFIKNDSFVDGTCNCGFDKAAKEFDQYEERTIRDIVSKLVKYGNLSDSQKVFVGKLLGNIKDRPAKLAARQAEKDAVGPVPTGRVTVEGVVLAKKESEGYGFSRYSAPETVWKLLIRLDNGSKVWGSRFANLDKGSRIKFTASFEASKDDPKFGFYKRPVVWQSPEQKKAVKTLQHAVRTVSAEDWDTDTVYATENAVAYLIRLIDNPQEEQ